MGGGNHIQDAGRFFRPALLLMYHYKTQSP